MRLRHSPHRRQIVANCLLVLCSALLVGTSLTNAQDGDASLPAHLRQEAPNRVVLSYTGDAEGPRDQPYVTAGSLTEHLIRVGKMMNGEFRVDQDKAVISLLLFGRLVERENMLPQVKLDVRTQLMQVGPKLKDRREVQREMNLILSKLRRWELDLDAGQVTALERDGRLVIPVNGPFDNLHYLGYASPSVTVMKEPEEERVEVRFVREFDGSFFQIHDAVFSGEVFYVELVFAEEPTDTSAREITLNSPVGSRTVRVSPVADEPVKFRSGALILDIITTAN